MQVNGETLELQARPGMYMQVTWQWTARDVVQATFPARVWAEPLRDKDDSYASMHAVMYGPLVLAGCVPSCCWLLPCAEIVGRGVCVYVCVWGSRVWERKAMRSREHV